MSHETPNREAAIGTFVPVVAPPFTRQVLNSKGIVSFERVAVGQYLVTLQRPVAFADGHAVAGLPANFQALPGAVISEDGSQVLVSVLSLSNGAPIDPPIVTLVVSSVQEGEGAGPAIPFPVVPPPIPSGAVDFTDENNILANQVFS